MIRERQSHPEAPIGAEDRAYLKTKEYLKGHDLSGVTIGYASDGEGPQFCGDTAADSMNIVFPGTVTAPDGHVWQRGHYMHRMLGHWYDNKVHINAPDSQIGTAVSLGLPLLTAAGVTDEQLIDLAHTSKSVPGSEAWRRHSRKTGGHILCVTTSSEVHHRPLGRALGLDGMVGTDMSIDRARRAFDHASQGEDELDSARAFIDRSMALMDGIEVGTLDPNELTESVAEYYLDTVGILRGPRQHRTTIAAQQIDRTDLMGSTAKRGAAKAYFEALPETAVRVAIGDGSNDKTMLHSVSNSIGVNGWQAANASTFGLITHDMSVMATLGEILKDVDPERTRRHQEVINRVRGSDAFKKAGAELHAGGRLYRNALSLRYRQMHNEAREAVRGAVGIALI